MCTSRCSLILPLLAPLAFAACAAPRAVRVVEDSESGRLQVHWIRLEPPPGRPPVILVNMAHVAESRFYVEAQALLDRTAVVLMEGIVRVARQTDRSETPRIAAGLYDIARELRLSHQRNALLLRQNWRKADIGEVEYRGLLHRLGHSASTPGLRVSLREFKRDVGFAIYRYGLDHPELSPAEAEQRARTGIARRRYAEMVLSRGADSVGHREVMQTRNRVAMLHLDRCGPEGEVAMCFGFVHGPYLERALLDRGYRIAGTSWHTAFSWPSVDSDR